MDDMALFAVVVVAGSIYLAVKLSAPLSGKRGSGGDRLLLVLAVAMSAGVSFVAGERSGEAKMFEQVDAAMTDALPASMYRRVMTELGEREEARNARGEATAGDSGVRYQ